MASVTITPSSNQAIQIQIDKLLALSSYNCCVGSMSGVKLKTRRMLRRIGCGALIVLWFVVLMLPCLAVVLATQHEIVLTHSDIPDDNFRIWLIQDAKQRGIAISNSTRVDGADGAICTVTDSKFLMWQGQADPSHYCSCYAHQDNNWSSIAEGDDACKMVGQ
jgi:hypothetical protein